MLLLHSHITNVNDDRLAEQVQPQVGNDLLTQ